MVEGGLAAYGYTLDPSVREIFTRYRKTHNDGAFDAYPADVLAARRSHVITGLPDAYGRGRIIGDYRRVPLYGVSRLIAAKQAEKAALDAHPSTAEIIRDREELAEHFPFALPAALHAPGCPADTGAEHDELLARLHGGH